VAKASTPYRFAKVLEVGPGRVNPTGAIIPVNIAVGDVVAYSKNSGVEMPLDDADGNERVVLLINEQYVLGIIKDMPEQSAITGLDGRLLTMQPGSRARSDGAYQALDSIARARKDGFIDTQGGVLEDMERMDTADAEAD
jgi:co-chaperonin GroES (HSP10)